MARRTPYLVLLETAEAWNRYIDKGYPEPGNLGGRPSAASMAARDLSLGGHDAPFILRRRLATADALGISVLGSDWLPLNEEEAADVRRAYEAYDVNYLEALSYRENHEPDRSPASSPRRAKRAEVERAAPSARTPPTPPQPAQPRSVETPDPSDRTALAKRIAALLRRGPLSFGEVEVRLGIDEADLQGAIGVGIANGILFRTYRRSTDFAPTVIVDAEQPLGTQEDHGFELRSDANGVVRFAVASDQHLCSKYAREDCLNEFYDQVARRGITTVLNAGNWIDGEATFNKFDLKVHGMDAQMRYLAEHYPHRDGVVTAAITGADHEGWYSRREGIDVGQYAANTMKHAGRSDWVDLGFMECFIPLVHSATGASTQLCLMHPGGGSSYALSYAPQRIVEGFDGGSKPAVLVIGHYHKSGYNLIRNVHTMQAGAFQDQTIFMRQKKLAAHVGGCFVELHLDPENGAVLECGYTFRNYYNVGYYKNRWSQHAPVEMNLRAPQEKG